MSVHQLHLGRYWHYETYRYVDNIEGTRVPPMLVSLQEIARPALRAAAEVSRSWNRGWRPSIRRWPW